MILNSLIEPLSLQIFLKNFLYVKPYAAPSKANQFVNLLSWNLLNEIFNTGHNNCWLPKQGHLPSVGSGSTGTLTLQEAKDGFFDGRTILIRQSEKAHPILGVIARDFQRTLQGKIDVQLYCTPSNQEGFDWHYDLEEVFVLQSRGEKEFFLRKNRHPITYDKVKLPKDFNSERDCEGPEIRCHLKPGDWLYIPSGWWHKAHALTDSFHMSVGVLRPRR